MGRCDLWGKAAPFGVPASQAGGSRCPGVGEGLPIRPTRSAKGKAPGEHIPETEPGTRHKREGHRTKHFSRNKALSAWPSAAGILTRCFGNETRRSCLALEEEGQRLSRVLWVRTAWGSPFSGRPDSNWKKTSAGQVQAERWEGRCAPSGGQPWSHTGGIACAGLHIHPSKGTRSDGMLCLNAASGLLWQLERLLNPKYN